jgi:hypothetical protein
MPLSILTFLVAIHTFTDTIERIAIGDPDFHSPFQELFLPYRNSSRFLAVVSFQPN